MRLRRRNRGPPRGSPRVSLQGWRGQGTRAGDAAAQSPVHSGRAANWPVIKSLHNEVAMTTVTTAPTDSGMQSWQGHRGQHQQSGLITAKT